MPAYRFILSGRVQGVGFRYWTVRRANQLGIVGTVCNRPDGTVEVFASGSESALDDFRSALRAGPAAARVEKMAQTEAREPDVLGFHIID